MRSKIRVIPSQQDNNKNSKKLPISIIICIELVIVALLLTLINAFPNSTDASIELGNLNVRSKRGTWMVNQHKINKSQISIKQKHNHEYVYYNHKPYKLIPHISKKQLATNHIKKLYKDDRIFKIYRTYSKKNHRKHSTKILVQTKAPRSLNKMPSIYSSQK